MTEDEQPDRRQSLLVFLERHWDEFSLRDASALSLEFIDGSCDATVPMIKETLTYS